MGVFGKRSKDRVKFALSIWQDCTVRFDNKIEDVTKIPGERVIVRFENVIDLLGNPGLKGTLVLTNLRIVWYLFEKQSINISIGWRCVNNLYVKAVKDADKSKGMHALHISATSGVTRYNFNFLHNGGRMGMFSAVHRVRRAYDTSHTFRDVLLRASLFKAGEIRLLPNEIIVEQYGGVCSVVKDEGWLGEAVLTNLRFIWFSQNTPNFNVSIPLSKVCELDVVNSSKFGHILTITTLSMVKGKAKENIYGFRIAPGSRCTEIFTKVKGIVEIVVMRPDFGVRFSKDKESPAEVIDRKEDVVATTEDKGVSGGFGKLLKYSQEMEEETTHDVSKEEEKPDQIAYNPFLGLSVEYMKNVNISEIWTL
ncbi:Bardet-Biedl syndrome 5 protein like protein [Aduncisulcus paluster]|uniref:Bardet-Biedl syndrome 5 protein like protein n=1 Tax=Aduncisulcus paluster TaxID=2918883 RepID=A0ABQ5K3J1_9EUKA|nr:Bardet-Biedl syndrome 5 protein like protein [Aduncisulcus paluster]